MTRSPAFTSADGLLMLNGHPINDRTVRELMELFDRLAEQGEPVADDLLAELISARRDQRAFQQQIREAA